MFYLTLRKSYDIRVVSQKFRVCYCVFFKTVLWTCGNSALSVQQNCDGLMVVYPVNHGSHKWIRVAKHGYAISVVFKLCGRSCANSLEWCLV
jgi:hypothetical protein